MSEEYKPDIWLKQDNETDQHFGWFSAYLACPKPRTIEQAYKNYLDDHPEARNRGTRLPYDWHMASLGLDQSGEPNGLSSWMSRASAYDEWKEEAELYAERAKKLSARDVRRGFMGRMEKLLTSILDVVDANNPQQVRAASHAFSTFLDQSRQEYNDLPVTRRDLTTGDQKIKNVTIVWERNLLLGGEDEAPTTLLNEGEKVESDSPKPDASSNSAETPSEAATSF